MASNRRSNIRRVAAALGTAALLTGGAVPAATAAPSSSDIFPFDQFGRPNPWFEENAREAINNPAVPEEVKAALNKALDFLAGEGEPGIDIPTPGPEIQQFLPPTAAEKCINGEGRSFGLATSVPGPAGLPLPGVGPEQTAFVFTGLGTAGVAKEQRTEMNVHWFNLANARYGTTQLKYTGINPDGPGTVNGTADTGKGLVLAALEGGFTSAESVGPVDCEYTPTFALIRVGF
ncbi:hypothetical protein KRX51_03795 [Corynebacterium sp. TAE3-ERU12]|uniref:Rv1157c family protein n=1 Tax=Corynebacterium sp. TAE3-ERU12 TaxID=2849491 RepID=UPI001C4724BD|nr:hypothetical protein [Corynebacterium sp. TAE3-ERU12]MBV7295040.1 hypothetical protein [Corynebacterium sp. TAE3-ERU12]